MRSLLTIYALHAPFWGVFVARMLFGCFSRARIAGAPRAEVPRTAPGARLLVGLHSVAIGLMYLALGFGLSRGGVSMLFAPKPLVGVAIILSATGLAAWALLWFRSWRVSAQIDRGHELATGGPFALIRHPIYTSVNLVGLSTFLWVPSWPVLMASILVVIGSDLRARAEERLLLEAFGDQYRVFMHRRRRFLPFVY